MTVDGPGMLYTSRNNGSSWDTGTTAAYYQTVDVAFGLRPYINEANATLLLAADRALVAQLQQATVVEQAAVTVTLRLPFAATTAARTVTWRGDKLLQRSETVLSFPLASLPATVNQDVRHCRCLVRSTSFVAKAVPFLAVIRLSSRSPCRIPARLQSSSG